jgi:hypothetical protein
MFQIYFTVVTFLTVARRCSHVEVGSLRWLSTEVRRRPFDPSNLPWTVSQCPFDPYQAGAKVYRAYWAGGRPGRAACPTDNLEVDGAPTFALNALVPTAVNDVLPDGALTTVCTSKQNLTTSLTILLKCITLCLFHEADLYCK